MQKSRNLPKLFLEGMNWESERRSQILHLFEQEVFGVSPSKDLFKTKWIKKSEVKLDIGDKFIYEIVIEAPRGEFRFPLFLYTPREKEKVETLLYVGNRPRKAKPVEFPKDLSLDELKEILKKMGLSLEALSKEATPKDCDLENELDLENWPVRKILKRGYATAAFYTEDIEPDYVTDLKEGIIHKFDDVADRKSNAWATIAAWSFGASRAIDCLVEHPSLNANLISIVGHSRGGKTALWCAANDSRVYSCYANNSGCTGAALSRGKKGEQIKDINTLFPYWFCENYKKYSSNEDMLPIDQHMLLALIAPRPLYLASATEDYWADPESEFESALEASIVYEKYGLKGICDETYPHSEKCLHEGMIGYHIREGGHALMSSDWMNYCDYLEKKSNK